MAAHPKRAVLNGHAAIGPIKTLEKIAQYYERRAASVREAIEAFAEFRGAKKRQTIGATLGEAITIDRERRAPTAPPRRRDGGHRDAIAARRAESAVLLARFDPSDPRPGSVAGRAVASFVLHGYLKHKGSGYVRTAKPFTP